MRVDGIAPHTVAFRSTRRRRPIRSDATDGVASGWESIAAAATALRRSVSIHFDDKRRFRALPWMSAEQTHNR
jgi:hypothetical protein